MGDPKKQKKKYDSPSHPWQGARIKAERVLMRDYGLKNKKELWKMGTILKDIKTQAKLLTSKDNEESKKEKDLLLKRLSRLGIIKTADAKLEDILSLDVRTILERRLQTLMLRKGLAKTAKQARQFIIHGHVLVKENRMDVPSYIVPVEEENSISFSPMSTLDSLEHPERSTPKKEKPKSKSETEKEFEEAKEAAEVVEKLKEVEEEVAEEKTVEQIEKTLKEGEAQ